MRLRHLPLFCFLPVLALSLSAAESHKLTLTIDYGTARPLQQITTAYIEGSTALELLKKAAMVQTRQVGEFEFVASINGVKSIPGKMGWFYTLDGEKAKVTASKQRLEGTTAMAWRYREDHCLAP